VAEPHIQQGRHRLQEEDHYFLVAHMSSVERRRAVRRSHSKEARQLHLEEVRRTPQAVQSLAVRHT